MKLDENVCVEYWGSEDYMRKDHVYVVVGGFKISKRSKITKSSGIYWDTKYVAPPYFEFII